MQLDEGELAGPVDRHEHVELALLGADLGYVVVKVANGVCAELAALGFITFHLGQSADVVALQTAVQRRSGQMRNACLQGIETVIQGTIRNFVRGGACRERR